MLVGVFDVPAVLVLGALSALFYRWRLRRRSENWYLFLTVVVVGLAWTAVWLGNATALPYWGVDAPTVTVGLPVAGFYVLSYPLWFRAAGELLFVLLGRDRTEGGVLWVFRLADRTDSLEGSWRLDRSRPSDDEE